MSCIKRERRERKAFTLIELLVVIAIIALLLSIVTPSLNKAKMYARRIICISNARQQGVGLATYAQENDDRLIGMYRISDGKYYAPNTSADTATTTYEKPDPYNTARAFYEFNVNPSTGKHIPYNLALLYEHDYIGTPEIFYCPGQAKRYTGYAPTTYEAYTRNGGAEWGEYYPEGSNGFVRVSYDYWTYEETRLRNINSSKPIIVDEIHMWERMSHKKHGDGSDPHGITTCYADGHVSFCTDDYIFSSTVWKGAEGGGSEPRPHPANNIETFESILRALQGH